MSHVQRAVWLLICAHVCFLKNESRNLWHLDALIFASFYLNIYETQIKFQYVSVHVKTSNHETGKNYIYRS